MEKIKYLLFLFVLCVATSGFSQRQAVKTSSNRSFQKITGKVIDEKGNTLPGVTVLEKGTKVGTITDVDGNYELNKVPLGAVLVFSFIGMASNQINVGEQPVINVTMKESASSLNEVVVTALGITKTEKSLGYSQQTVNVTSMTEAQDANFTNMLAGKAAGVDVISGGGSTASTRVQIRGIKSLTGNNQPLYVVDGVIIQNDMGKTSGTSMGASDATDIDYGNTMADINPDDIASIDILKGGSASALYGSDAANGVIVITTKKGANNNDFGVTYSVNDMQEQVSEFPPFQNTYGGGNSSRLGETNAYRSMVYQSMAVLTPYNGSSWGVPMTGFDVVGRNGVVKTYSPNPDNVKDFFSTASQLTNNVSISKSNDSGSFRFSYANTASDDVVKGVNDRSRNDFAITSTYNINKAINVAANVRYSIDRVDNRNYSGESNRNLLVAYVYFPRDMSLSELTPWKDASGNAIQLSTNTGQFLNPYWTLNEDANSDTKNWLLADFTMNIKFTKDLALKLMAAADIQNSNGYDFDNMGQIGMPNGYYGIYSRDEKNYQYQGVLTYNKRINKFSISAMLGANWTDNSLYVTTSSTSDLIVHNVKSLSNSAEAIQSTELLQTMRKEGVFADATIGYKDWIYLDLTGRNDWNSTLPVTNCSFFYPAASLSFLFTDAFNLPKNILTFGKLRASTSEVGNGTSFNQLYNNYIYSGIFNSIPVFSLGTQLKNSELKPEETFSNEAGTNLRFLKNMLSLDLTYYSSRTLNDIVNPEIPPSTGYQTGTLNAGEITNKGIEVTINATPIEKKDFSWNMTLNWAKNYNKVVAISDSLSTYTITAVNSQLNINAEKGKPFGVLRGSRQMRDADGNLMVNAATGDPFIQQNAYLGQVSPDFTGSFVSSFKVKNFDFSFMLSYQAGGKLFSETMLDGDKQGNFLPTLAGRNDYTFSGTVLGESASERLGQNNNEPALAYPDPDNRVMGAMFKGMLYSYNATTQTYTKIGPNTNLYIQPQTYWSQTTSYLMDQFIYDASFIKLAEMTLGYTVPSSFMSKTPIKSVRFSLVARNLVTLFKNTPKGIDPQATASTGNDQGVEAGYTLPTAYYGFDLKVTF
jgi:TonB-linked SusC/RagA family outer membrane protein